MKTHIVLWTLLCGLAAGCSCSNHADADAQAWYEQVRNSNLAAQNDKNASTFPVGAFVFKHAKS